MVRSAEEEYDYEEEPAAAPVTPAPARSGSGRLGGLLSSRGRVSVGRKSAAPAVSCLRLKIDRFLEAGSFIINPPLRRNRPRRRRSSNRPPRRRRRRRRSWRITKNKKRRRPRPPSRRRKFAVVSDRSGNFFHLVSIIDSLRGNGCDSRSNQDLLDALKRRRAQAGPTTSHRDTSATQSATESTTPKSK